jgi:hypothetical protein
MFEQIKEKALGVFAIILILVPIAIGSYFVMGDLAEETFDRFEENGIVGIVGLVAELVGSTVLAFIIIGLFAVSGVVGAGIIVFLIKQMSGDDSTM